MNTVHVGRKKWAGAHHTEPVSEGRLWQVHSDARRRSGGWSLSPPQFKRQDKVPDR